MGAVPESPARDPARTRHTSGTRDSGQPCARAKPSRHGTGCRFDDARNAATGTAASPGSTCRNEALTFGVAAQAQPRRARKLTAAAAPGLPAAACAGLARRLGSLGYEALLLAAIVFITAFALVPLVSPGPHGDARALIVPSLPARVMLFCTLFAVLAGYFVWSWTGGRRTLPMKTWHLRIVASGDRPPTRKAALARFLAGWVGPASAIVAYAALRPAPISALALVLLPLNFLWAFVDRDHQFLHDRIARTRIAMAA